jgi:hypothetical protein
VNVRAEEILDHQARLTGRLLSPDWAMTDFTRFFMQDAWAKSLGGVTHDRRRAAGMFYPVVPKDTKTISTEQAVQMMRVLGVGLRDATCYQVTADMVHVMHQAYLATETNIERLDIGEMPEANGFVWLDESWPIRDSHQETSYVRAFQWQYTTALTNGTEAERIAPQKMDCVRISLWSHVDDEVHLNHRMTPERAAETTRELGVLTLLHTAVVPFNLRFTTPPEIDKAGIESFLGLVHLVWMFLGMEIVTTPKAHIPRPFVRRALKTLKHGEVQVIMLRRLAHPATGEEVSHRDVDWRCQWVVQGHWRHLATVEGHLIHRAVVAGPAMSDGHQHCLQCDGPVTWVRPYVKGPDGRPLKVSRTLMRLAR